ncbi:MAG TPA: SxtJ family membrane protein [Phycisphaerae bacterium]|nr:SxtJ family membrane protein [Phycisphaerae bacterium]
MSLVTIDWHPDPRALRRFGLTVLVGTGACGAFLWFWSGAATAALVVWGVGAALGLPGLTGTRVALPGYRLWMGLAFVLGSVMGRVLLGLLWFGLITPMGLAMRLFGRDRLELRRKNAASLWRDLPPPDDPVRHERQF